MNGPVIMSAVRSLAAREHVEQRSSRGERRYWNEVADLGPIETGETGDRLADVRVWCYMLDTDGEVYRTLSTTGKRALAL